MKVLCTGASGFVGSHLGRELREHGHEVVALSHTSRYDRFGVPIDHRGDLLISGYARHLVGSLRPSVVVHLAGLVGGAANADPAEAYRSNAGMTSLVAMACKEAGVRLVVASTLDAENPASIYAASKAAAEEAAWLLGGELLILRLAFPYGPGIQPGEGRNAITNFLWQAHTGRVLTPFRDDVRAWCYVGDVVRGMRMAVEQGMSGSVDIGSRDEQTMEEVAVLACRVTSSESEVEVVDPPQRTTTPWVMVTPDDWEPVTSLEDGMRFTLNWLLKAEA